MTRLKTLVKREHGLKFAKERGSLSISPIQCHSHIGFLPGQGKASNQNQHFYRIEPWGSKGTESSPESRGLTQLTTSNINVTASSSLMAFKCSLPQKAQSESVQTVCLQEESRRSSGKSHEYRKLASLFGPLYNLKAWDTVLQEDSVLISIWDQTVELSIGEYLPTVTGCCCSLMSPVYHSFPKPKTQALLTWHLEIKQIHCKPKL